MTTKPNPPVSDDFELQPSVEAFKAPEPGPAPNPIHEPTVDGHAFDPSWAKSGAGHGRSTPGRGSSTLGHARSTPGKGNASIPLKRTTGAQKLPHEQFIPDAPPPREKVDFENLPAFVEQRKLLQNIKITGALIFALVIALTLYFVFRTSTGTVKPIVDELRKDTPGIEQLIDRKPAE